SDDPPNSPVNGPIPPSPAPAVRRASTSSQRAPAANASASNTHPPNPNAPRPKRWTSSTTPCDAASPNHSPSNNSLQPTCELRRLPQHGGHRSSISPKPARTPPAQPTQTPKPRPATRPHGVNQTGEQ